MAKDNNKNKQYTIEFKNSVLKRLEPPSNETIPKISEELNISRSTIYQWVKNHNKKKSLDTLPGNNNPFIKWSSEDKFHVVLETAPLTEEELSSYCRSKGLYVDDVKNWRDQCLKANSTVLKDPQKIEDELKEEKQKTKALEKDLRIKEKALAETAALLVLRKKAQAIWGDPEDE